MFINWLIAIKTYCFLEFKRKTLRCILTIQNQCVDSHVQPECVSPCQSNDGE